MMTISKHTMPGLGVAAVAAVALLAAGCGSSGSTSTAKASSAAATTSVASNAAASGAVVKVTHGAHGAYLTDGSGRALYLWMADASGQSHCSGACAQAWPPLMTKGTPKASAGVASGKLTTFTRSDGSKQVVYDGHPLYYFAGDTGPGTTAGQGSDGFGAKWWLVAPSGASITTAGGSSSSSSSVAGY